MKTHSGRRNLASGGSGEIAAAGVTEPTATAAAGQSGAGDPNNRYVIDNRELEELEKHAREGSPYGGKQFVQQLSVDQVRDIRISE